MSAASNTPTSPKAKAAYRREKRLLLKLAEQAETLAEPYQNHAELYFGRLLVAQTIRALTDLRVDS